MFSQSWTVVVLLFSPRLEDSWKQAYFSPVLGFFITWQTNEAFSYAKWFILLHWFQIPILVGILFQTVCVIQSAMSVHMLPSELCTSLCFVWWSCFSSLAETKHWTDKTSFEFGCQQAKPVKHYQLVQYELLHEGCVVKTVIHHEAKPSAVSILETTPLLQSFLYCARKWCFN